ncbi:GIY-YIG nuclease family protein, partial [Patescibacteria group bacterium]|nr:GIY-YIG nuclease family protein [Patescibacteria group bacterium]
TNNIARRIHEHKTKYNPRSFSAQYNLKKLLYYEDFDYVWDAINREKQIKAGSRKKKIALIVSMNPTFEDLSADW